MSERSWAATETSVFGAEGALAVMQRLGGHAQGQGGTALDLAGRDEEHLSPADVVVGGDVAGGSYALDQQAIDAHAFGHGFILGRHGFCGVLGLN